MNIELSNPFSCLELVVKCNQTLSQNVANLIDCPTASEKELNLGN